jgi:hypothetical protein
MREHSRMLLGLVVGAGLGLVARALAGDAPWLQWTLTNVTGPSDRSSSACSSCWWCR